MEENTSPDALEEAVRGLKDVELDTPVGKSFEYSNANYTVLGLIVQVVSGEPYAVEHIFSPLKKSNSFAYYPEAEEHGLAQGYRLPVRHPPSCRDLLRRRLRPLGWRNGRDAPPRRLSANMMGQETGHGMGWFTRNMSGARTIADLGANLAYRADTILMPEGKWGGAVFAQGSVR